MSRTVASLQAPTRQFLNYLQSHPEVRAQIRAPEHATLLYAGKALRNAWQELAALKDQGVLGGLQTLPDVLAQIPAPGTGHASLLAYTQAVCDAVPWEDDGFIVWRALPGIFASQAKGRVSFHIGAGISSEKDDVAQRRVFAMTELHVLARNPHLDTLTGDVLAYYLRCLKNRNHAMSFSFIGGAAAGSH
jgi:hypothetical protein